MDSGGQHYNETKWTENEEGTPLKENLIIIHGAGPTAVLNCSPVWGGPGGPGQRPGWSMFTALWAAPADC